MVEARRRGPGALVFFFLSWLFFSPVTAGIVNRTIDDVFGDSDSGAKVIFLPALATRKVWETQTCAGCAIKADTSQAFKGTYTAATYAPDLGSISATMDFEGTAIYVFFILANNAGDGITTLTATNFTLDNGPPVLFQHTPDLTTKTIQYNQLVYSTTNLINAKHRLTVSTSGINTNVYVNFDYAIYTHDDDAPLLPLPPAGGSTSTSTTKTTTSSATPTPTTSVSTVTKVVMQSSASTTPTAGTSARDSSATQSSPIGAIVGGIIAGILALCLLTAAIVWYMRRQRRKSLEQADIDWIAERKPDPVIVPFGVPQAPGSTGGHSSSNINASYPQSGNYPQPANYPQPNYYPNPYQNPHNYSQHSVVSANSAQQVPPPPPMSDAMSAYGGYVDASVSGRSHTSNPGSNETPRRGFVSVTDGDHISQPDQMYASAPPVRSSAATSEGSQSAYSHGSAPVPLPALPAEREDVRRERQRQLDEQLRAVQQEMNFLRAETTGEKPLTRKRTVRRDERSGQEEEVEMSMDEMKEQLKLMKTQISSLRDQQRSAWALGLSDDPPPGYTPGSALSMPITTHGHGHVEGATALSSGR